MSIKDVCEDPKYSGAAVQAGFIPAIVKVLLSNIRETEVLAEAVLSLANVAAGDDAHRTAFHSTPNSIQSLIELFQGASDKALLLALSKCVASVAKLHDANQRALVDGGIAAHVSTLTKTRHADLQLSAVKAIRHLAEENPVTQKAILPIVNLPLMQMLKKSRSPILQEETAVALWALASGDHRERRNMATDMGVSLFIEFLSSLSENLHYIGSEGLGVLAQGPKSEQTAIGKVNGLNLLVSTFQLRYSIIINPIIEISNEIRDKRL